MERFFEEPRAAVERWFAGWISIFNVPDLADLLNPDLRAACGEEFLYRSIHQRRKETEGFQLSHRLLYLNFMTYLPDYLHVNMDRMSMATPLEARFPILDTALVEFVAALSPDAKIHAGRMKHILRVAF